MLYWRNETENYQKQKNKTKNYIHKTKKYIHNPKTKGSGIICCIPQEGNCPIECVDCFFQSGNSYLEPLDENLPNMPSLEEVGHRVVRVNDGNDSNNKKELVMEACRQYPLKFYNTSVPENIELFDAPVVLTINPGKKTDRDVVLLKKIPNNLMFVRVRVNTWNLGLVDKAVDYYASRNKVPVILTFMAYNSMSPEYRKDYVFRKRTLNSYWAITTKAWKEIMELNRHNIYVYSCGKIEGEKGETDCARCGNCIREFFVTKERMLSSGAR